MNKRTILIVIGCFIAAGLSFVATVMAQNRAGENRLAIPAKDWSRATALDQSFPEESRKLTETLAAERNRFADLLDDANVSDQALLDQMEKVLAAQGALERRVAQHLIKIRHQLTPAQQKQVMGLASEKVRRGGWHGGRGQTTMPSDDPTTRSGRKRQGKEN